MLSRFWIICSAVLVVAGTVCYIQSPWPNRNPLLTANIGQLDRWVPLYPVRCGDILFDKPDPTSHNFGWCIDEIRKRAGRATDKQLSREDVLDARVKQHWREVMGEH